MVGMKWNDPEMCAGCGASTDEEASSKADEIRSL